jgi:hypothetical protein
VRLACHRGHRSRSLPTPQQRREPHARTLKELSLEDKVADLKGSVVAVESMLCALIESIGSPPMD